MGPQRNCNCRRVTDLVIGPDGSSVMPNNLFTLVTFLDILVCDRDLFASVKAADDPDGSEVQHPYQS